MGHEPTHQKEATGILPWGGPPAYEKTTTEGHKRELEVPFSDWGDGGGRAGWGGDLCCPPAEHSCTVHYEPPDHGPVYGDGAVPWSKGFQVVVGKGYLDMVGAQAEATRAAEVEKEEGGLETGTGTGHWR